MARLVLNKASAVAGEADVQTAEKVLVSAIDGLGARQKKRLWDGLWGLCPTQSFLRTLRRSSPTALETPRCTRWERHSCYHNALKPGESGSLQ